MNCKRCNNKCDSDCFTICSGCHEKHGLCMCCGEADGYGKSNTCRDCQLKAYGKCGICDEPAESDVNSLFCSEHTLVII